MSKIELYNQNEIENKLKELESFCPEIINYLPDFIKMSESYLYATEDLFSDEDNEITYEKMNVRDSVILVRNYLETLSTNYVENFDKLLSDGTIDIFLPEDDLYERPDYPILIETSPPIISIPITETLQDGMLLVHEFFHYTNEIEKNEIGIRTVFTEMISIYFEFRYCQFLDKKGYGNKNFSKSIIERLDSTFDSANSLYCVGSCLDIYNTCGKINKKNAGFVDKYRYLSYKKNAKILLSFYKDDNFCDDLYDFESDISYLIGSLLATQSLNNPEVNDIRINYINNNLNFLNLEQVLKVLETKIEDYPKWLDETINYLKKAIGEIYEENYSYTRTNSSRKN